jgi:predicted RNA methylase
MARKKSNAKVEKIINDIKSIAKIPPFLSIDQEGGRVERTENLFGGKKFLSAKASAQKGEKFVKEQCTDCTCELLQLIKFDLPKTYKFQKDKSRAIEVVLVKVTKTGCP